MRIKVAFIINRTKKYSRSTAMTLEIAKLHRELDIHLFYTDGPKHAVSLARTAVLEGYEVIVAVGGDGTINEVANGIIASDYCLEVLFGIVPNGTGNDFQKYLGVFNPHHFIESILHKKYALVDLIRVTTIEKSTYSINIAGTGFDGQVVQTLQNSRKFLGLNGRLSYPLAILQSFLTFRKLQVNIKAKEFEYTGKLMMVAVCNGTTLGHGLNISPNAKIDDGILNVTLLGNVSFLDYVKNLHKLKKGEFIEHPEVSYYKTEKISLSSSVNNLFTQVDGEHFCSGDVEFSIIKKGIRLLKASD